MKDYCAAVVRGGAPACLVFSPTTFSPSGYYLTLLSFGSFGHYDEGTYTSKGLTPDQAKELNQRRLPAIAANPECGIALQPQLSFFSDEPGSLALITDLRIGAGTLPTLRSHIQKVELPAARAAGFLSFELYQVVAGGDLDRYLLIRRFRTFKQLDAVVPLGDSPWPPGSPPGETVANSIKQRSTSVMRVRSDISAQR